MTQPWAPQMKTWMQKRISPLNSCESFIIYHTEKRKKNNKITENETIKWNRGDFELKVHFKPRLARTKIERWKLTVVRVCPFLVSSGQPTIQSAIFDRCWCWCMHETENVFVWKYKSPFIQMLFERHTLAGTNKINKIYEKIKKKTLNISRERWNSFIYR